MPISSDNKFRFFHEVASLHSFKGSNSIVLAHSEQTGPTSFPSSSTARFISSHQVDRSAPQRIHLAIIYTSLSGPSHSRHQAFFGTDEPNNNLNSTRQPGVYTSTSELRGAGSSAWKCHLFMLQPLQRLRGLHI